MPETAEDAGGCAVGITDGTLAEQAGAMAGDLAAEGIASRTAAPAVLDSTRALLAEIDSLRGQLRDEGVDRVVLVGIGRAALAAEIIAGFAGVTMIVVDTTDADQVADALAGDLSRTVLVICSGTETAVEVDTLSRIFAAAFEESGVEAGNRTVAVTEPDSDLAREEGEGGYRRVFLTEAGTGARDALSAYSIVPAGLAGADVSALLDDAATAADSLAVDDPGNPGLVLGAALAAAREGGADKLVLTGRGTAAAGFCYWAGSLVDALDPPEGHRMLPVVVGSPAAAGFFDAGGDATTVVVGQGTVEETSAAAVALSGTPAGLFLLWERGIAAFSHLLGCEPFAGQRPEPPAVAWADAPHQDTRGAPRFAMDEVEVYAGDWLPGGTAGLVESISALVAAVPVGGHLAVHAYLDRIEDASTVLARDELARRTGIQTTFDWAPRVLHTAGTRRGTQPPSGAFLQITGMPSEDLPVPGLPYTLAALQREQALSDAAALTASGHAVLRLHLTDRLAGLATLVGAIQTVRTSTNDDTG